VTQPEITDKAAEGLITLLHEAIYEREDVPVARELMPARYVSFFYFNPFRVAHVR
jgi:hypothetical protein